MHYDIVRWEKVGRAVYTGESEFLVRGFSLNRSGLIQSRLDCLSYKKMGH